MPENFQNFEFTFNLKCYPVSFSNKRELEKGDKIILPPSILQNLSEYNLSWPLMFELFNKSSSKRTNCGVIEFTSDEGCSFIPQWVMEKLSINKGEKVFFKYSPLEKGSYVKLQPQTEDFLQISNPKAVLESKLRNFTCLTKEDMIAIEYNEKIFWLNILEVKPGNSISIIETDLNVDFAPPLVFKKNYYESKKKKNSLNKNNEKNQFKEEESSTTEDKINKGFKGKGFMMN